MKRCVIHIGMHKTGSTSIQNSLWRKLNNREWKYCTVGTSNHGSLLRTLLDNPSLAKNQKKSSVDEQQDWSNIAKEISYRHLLINKLVEDINHRPMGKNYLLSAEWLSSESANFAKIIELRQFLLAHVKKISVVGYVRSPKSYMESFFQQMLKLKMQKLDFTKLYPHYRKKIEKFDFAFAEENVMLWKFTPSSFANACVVHDFCQKLNIDFSPEHIERKNETLSREAIALLYTYRKYAHLLEKNTKFSHEENFLLVNCLIQLKGGKFCFASEFVKPVLEANRADIEWVEKRIGESLAEPDETSVDAIRSEKDLLRYQPESLLWLAQQLGDEYVEKYRPQMTPKEVATWMRALHLQLIHDNTTLETTSKNIKMNLKELVQQAKQNTDKLESISDAQAINLLAQVFKHINLQTELMDEGTLTIAGLGKFQVKQINREHEGKQVSSKKIVFHAAKEIKAT